MKKSLLLSVLLTTSIVVAACGGNDGNDNNTNDVDPGNDNTENVNNDTDGNDMNDGNNDNDNNNNNDDMAEGDAPQGGEVIYGFTQPFAGLFDWAHYAGQDDSLALKIFNGDALVKTGDDLRPEPHLAHDWEWSDDNKTVTFHLEEGVMWHNGEELTAEDFEYAWEVIAHADYTGPRVANVNIIEGFDEFNSGDADSLSGVEIEDDYTFSVTFKEATPNSIDSLWTYPMPKAHLEGIEVADLEDADEIRREPVGLGAYQVTNIISGEQVEFEAYEDYWRGAPNLDTVVYKVIDGSQAAELLAQGEVDIIDLPPGQAVTLEGDDRINLEEIEALSYSYIGFKLGHWDGEENVMDNEKFHSKELRHAFAHAIDRQGIIDSFSEGYGQVINAPESVISWAYPDESTLNQYEYDPDLAMELLAEAGYEDQSGDGFVDTPDGEEFTVNFMAMSGTDISEPRAQYIVQNLQDIGVNAQLQDGQLFEFNLFYDLVEEDDADIDLFMGAWGLSADPDPTGLWKSDDFWNFPRWVNEESDELIERGLSEEAFDDDYRREVYQEWHQLVNDELPLIPLNSPVDIYGIASDVGGVTVDIRDAITDPHLWYREQ
ncbi:oligopeptide ABC transporter substrate-binding protein [Salipaludibacillus keqinensis]|uniref:Oligopeptide ABC transporter substrate-binding protein n=1 Tax=Salipaludibacillus keqinensis TaxID=2045207 RepID=A0A323TQE5_9BACI|nr:oligopeptide ABC transporter substrate-binding protein [Salipaludibacillus keqinensis]PYZ91515.1 oligopeptide ABC transporter substrate-binding protein [Salipaludibacillus keqinensis]